MSYASLDQVIDEIHSLADEAMETPNPCLAWELFEAAEHLSLCIRSAQQREFTEV